MQNIRSRNFYDVFQRELGKAERLGLTEVLLTVRDKQQKGWEYLEVEESLDRIKSEGHSIKTERHDSNNEHGFFGYFIIISVSKSNAS